MRNWKARLALAALFVTSATAVVRAQDSSSMTGVVADSTGAFIPDAVIVLSNKLTGVTYKQTTDKQGSYRFVNVPANDGYVAVFSHDGFSTLRVDGIALSVGITRTQDEKLSAGTTAEVEVSAADQKVTLNTTDASIGNNVDVNLLKELPIYDRSTPNVLFSLQPGVEAYTNSVAGARADQNAVTNDGIDVNDTATGTKLIVGKAPVDSVQEFRGVIGGLGPSIGTGSGGQYQLVTKNGTDKFHGNINEYNRTTDYTANTWFNNLDGLPRTPLIQNQYGGDISGPIKKDKLYFYFDFLQSRIVKSTTAERTVPTASFKQGNLSYIKGGNCAASSRLNVDPECIGTVNSAQVAALDPNGAGFDPSLLAFIDTRYPDPNDATRGDGVNTEGYRFTARTPDNLTNYVGRLDYNLTATQKIFARVTIARENALFNPVQFPGDPETVPEIDRSYGYVVSHIWTIGKNKVNQFYYGDNVSKLGFIFAYNPTGANQYSFSSLSSPYTQGQTTRHRVPIPEVRDDFSWQLGTHDLSFGGTFKFTKATNYTQSNFNSVQVGEQGGVLSSGLTPALRPSDIGTSYTARSDWDAAFPQALGVIGAISSNFDYDATGKPLEQGSGASRNYRYYQTELYVGDTWKATPQVTLTYGLRYQLYSVPYETSGAQTVPYFTGYSAQDSTFDKYIQLRVAQSKAGISGDTSLPFINYELAGKKNGGPNLYAPSYKDLAPRFALAYNPAWSRKTVVNLSGNMVYDRTVTNAINALQDQSSYLFQGTNTNEFGGNGPAASLAVDPRLGANLSFASTAVPVAPAINKPFTPFVDANQTPYGLAQGSINYAVDPHLKDPYSITLNAGVQQELPGHTILKINYMGRMGRRLLAQADASQLIDFPDSASSQTLAGAFGALTLQERAGADPTDLAPEPWFEDVIPAGLGQANGSPNNTSFIGSILGTYGVNGDFADSIQTLALYTYYFGTPILPSNIGMASQIASNTYVTNKGSSNYNGLLVTVNKNLSNGLQFDFNYTWSHSIDNTSLVANARAADYGAGFICDVLRPRSCRGNSDFDVTNEISSDFLYKLPIGRGRQFLTKDPIWLDELIGGWSVSGLPSYRTGAPEQVSSDAYVAGYSNNVAAIFTGNKGDLRAKVNTSNGTVFQFAGGQAGADKALSDFTGPVGFTYGRRNEFRGPGAFLMDAGLAKTFAIIPSRGVDLKFRADAFNVFNHPAFALSYLDLLYNVSPFGQIVDTASTARVAQLSLRLEF